MLTNLFILTTVTHANWIRKTIRISFEKQKNLNSCVFFYFIKKTYRRRIRVKRGIMKNKYSKNEMKNKKHKFINYYKKIKITIAEIQKF